MEVGRRT